MPDEKPRYVYKVMVSQLPREFRFIHAATIAEAEIHGIVILLLGRANET